MKLTNPVTLGLKKSFGFGDRLGLATPGHLAAARNSGFAPIFAQQSIREMTRTQRTPEEVMTATQAALATANYAEPWGADADHLKTPEDVRLTAAAGFTFFTIDPSAHVNNDADKMPRDELQAAVAAMERDGVFPDAGWQQEFLHKKVAVSPTLTLDFDQERLWRAAVKYGRAIAHTTTMAQAIATACADRPFEMEVSVDETDSPTSAWEHLFFGRELQRRRVVVISLAPRFIGEFEKGIDYRGNLEEFSRELRRHVAVAKYCGPYKLSIHSGSDKFSIYPIIGRECGDLLHVKTAGTSYLEALRAVARTSPPLFAEIVEYSRNRFEQDRQSYHISTTPAEIAALPPYRSQREEPVYLDERVGRQLLHVTFGSVLTMGKNGRGRPFKEQILEVLQREAALHQELLALHFTKHISLLNQG